MTARRRETAATALALALVLAACAPAPPAAAPPAPVPRSDAGAHEAAGPDAEGYIGVVVSEEALDLPARFDGRVVSVPVRLGERVARGQLLASLDDGEARHAVSMVEAEEAAARAAREKAARELAVAAEMLARRRSAPELFPGEEILLAEQQEQAAQSNLEIAEAEVARAGARAASLRDALAAARIVAPFGGTIAARYREPGAVVRAGDPVVRLVGEGGVRVRFAVPPGEARALAEGGALTVKVPALDLALPGRILRISPEVDAASGMLFAEAALLPAEDADGREPSRAGLSGQTVRVLPAGGSSPG